MVSAIPSLRFHVTPAVVSSLGLMVPMRHVLNHLLTERDRLMAGSDSRIASINDRTILAVAEVVRRCEEIRDEVRGAICLT